MDTAVLQNALHECARRMTKLDVCAVHHAINFADAVSVLPLENDVESLLCNLVGIERIARAERAHECFSHPSQEAVRGHVRWLIANLPPGDFGKWCRWFGFSGGAAARIRLPRGYFTKDLADPDDIKRMLAVAAVLTSSQHYRAHLALGYMQGWLWAHGESSIDDFRRMNMPTGEAIKSAM